MVNNNEYQSCQYFYILIINLMKYILYNHTFTINIIAIIKDFFQKMKQQIKDKISYIFKLVFNFEFFISILSSLLIGAGHIVDIYLNNVGEIYFTEVQTLFFEYLLRGFHINSYSCYLYEER